MTSTDSTQFADHIPWMQRCLELAQKAQGRTAPNPMVGSVIVKAGQILGEGFHPGAGQPHAEVFALRQAGEAARGATLYVNLEPCNHYGRTPPCTEAILNAGIRQVIVGMIDPDQRVSGQGVARLRQAGLEVLVGVLEADCQRLNEAFCHRVLYQRPFGIFKYAMTLDGKIAADTGHSAWVTGIEARTAVHRLRASCDAVIVGGNTVRQDNPRLTTHGQSDHNPLRVVMSRQLNLPQTANLWDLTLAPTCVFTEVPVDGPQASFWVDRGVTVISVPHLTPTSVMSHLQQQGCLTVLWECGGTLAARAIDEGMVQKVWAFIAPKVIGGQAAPSPIGDLNRHRMTEALSLENIQWTSVGPDLHIEGYIPEAVWRSCPNQH